MKKYLKVEKYLKKSKGVTDAKQREESEQTGSPTVLEVHGYKEVCLLFITTYMCGINMPLQI